MHDPAPLAGTDHAAEYKASLGLKMFFVYGFIYAVFVAINVINPIAMEAHIFLGLNLASVYGFGLIIVALIMALIYNSMCNRKESELNGEEGTG
jgi:uncharacterized membrane protein (DUF485 family)